jgi:hypothetical protein
MPFDPNQKVKIELFASDLVVLYESLDRYQEAAPDDHELDPPSLTPSRPEYLALMHVLGRAQVWVEGESDITPDEYAHVVTTSYDSLDDRTP